MNCVVHNEMTSNDTIISSSSMMLAISLVNSKDVCFRIAVAVLNGREKETTAPPSLRL